MKGRDLAWLGGVLVLVAVLTFWWAHGHFSIASRGVLPPRATSNPNSTLAQLRQPDKQEVVLETTRGKITFELYPNVAPHHVAQIKRLVESGYYNGLLFHRVIPGFMIQFGDPNTRTPNRAMWGSGGSDQPRLHAEFSDLPHLPGTVSMARTADPNSATTQFFICVGTASFLDHQYSVFGQVVSGQDVADAISKVPRDPRDAPTQDVRVTKAYLIPHP